MEGKYSTSIELLRAIPDDQKVDHLISIVGKLEARGMKSVEMISESLSKLDQTMISIQRSNESSIQTVQTLAKSNSASIDRMAGAIEKMAGQLENMDDRMDTVEKTLIELGRLEQAESDLFRLGQRIDESTDKVIANIRDVERRVNKLEVDDAESRGSRKWTDKMMWKILVTTGALGGGGGLILLIYKLMAAAPKK